VNTFIKCISHSQVHQTKSLDCVKLISFYRAGVFFFSTALLTDSFECVCRTFACNNLRHVGLNELSTCTGANYIQSSCVMLLIELTHLFR